MPSNQHQAYTKYLRSPTWRKLRARVLGRDGRQCRLCGARSNALEVHHLTYERFTQELPEDLITLCHGCHESVHSTQTHLPRELNDG